jgi:polyisoprenoid-binding protein YceI
MNGGRVLVLAVLVGAGCTGPWQHPGEPPAPAALEPPVPTRAPATGPVLSLTPENTKISFVGSTARARQPGGFAKFSGTLTLPGDDPAAARIALAIDMDSTRTDVPALTQHLKSADFFDVARYPGASFVSTRIEWSTAPGATHVITGDLSFHGVTQSISIPATITVTRKEVSLEGTFTLRQSAFGVGAGAKVTNDEVPVTLSLRVPRG